MIDQIAATVPVLLVSVIGIFGYSSLTQRPLDSVFGLGLDIAFIVSCYAAMFLYQYVHLLMNKPTVGQSVARFLVETNARDFEAGRFHMFLESLGISLAKSDGVFWPATVHILIAAVMLPIWPLSLMFALAEPQKRFLWARLAGTQTIDMRGVLSK